MPQSVSWLINFCNTLAMLIIIMVNCFTLGCNSVCKLHLLIQTLSVSVVSSVATPMVGSVYSLTCTVTLPERLTDAGAMVTYQWLKNGAVVSGKMMATLSFSSLTFSDAGSYTCQASVTSSLLSDPFTNASSNSESVRLTCRLT